MHHAVIPARNGSKSILNKNLQRLTTKTLVEMALGQALSAGFFDTITLTTDIPILIDVYKEAKRIGLHERKPEHATDCARVMDAVIDVINYMHFDEDDYLWLLQPTSPFRNRQDFVEIKETIEATSAASAISVKRSIAEHPSKQGTVTLRMGRSFFNPIHDFFSFENKEQMKPMFIRNGGFYVARIGRLIKEKTFVLKPCIAHPMCDWRSTNIDSQLELDLAKALARQHGY